MSPGGRLEGLAGERRLPPLPDAGDSGRRSGGMRQDPAAAQIEQVETLDASVRLRRLTGPLTGRQHRHCLPAAEERLEAGTGRSDDRVVLLKELVPDPVRVEVIGTGQPPQLLGGDE